jgi:glycosyltransferase involved in cell wall biosynthesis
MKLLFVTPDIQWPLIHGAGIRKWNILQGLLSIASVDVIACGTSAIRNHDNAYAGCNRVFSLSQDLFRETLTQRKLRESNIQRLWTVLTNPLPQSLIKGDMYSAREFFREIVSRDQYSLIWVETLRCGTYLDIPNASHHTIRVLDGDDFSWIRDLGILRNIKGYGAKVLEYIDVLKMRQLELRCPNKYSYVIRCSDEDAKLQGGKNVIVIPNGTDVPAVANRKPGARLLFVGLLSYEPNRMGTEWFIRSVWPSIIKNVPNAHLDIVGKDPSNEILSASGKNGITVHGFVNDLTEFYESAAVSIVPLHAGGGTRLKILESLGRGVPVISTTIGAYGIPLTEFHGLIRRDNAEAFSTQCINALQTDTAEIQRAAQRGRVAVSENYDWKLLRKAVSGVANSLLSVKESPSTGY